MTTAKQMPDTIWAYYYDWEDQIVSCSVKKKRESQRAYTAIPPEHLRVIAEALKYASENYSCTCGICEDRFAKALALIPDQFKS